MTSTNCSLASKRPARFLAMRFAAKEAIVKAIGTGFAHGIWIRDVGMLPNMLGQPQVVFSERGRAVCNSSASAKGTLRSPMRPGSWSRSPC